MKLIFRIIETLGMLWLTFMSYAEVYRWADPNGVMHYTDEPVLGAQPLHNQPITTFSPESFLDDKSHKSATSPELKYYQSILIQAPKPQSTIWDANGKVPVIIKCQPGLRKHDMLVLLLDNQAVGTPTKNRLIALVGVDRGAHTLRAMIVNDQHKTIQSSESVVFYLQKPRIVKPELVDSALPKHLK